MYVEFLPGPRDYRALYLVALHADAEVLDERTRRRRWQFTCRAADDVINRAAAADPRTGDQIAAALWLAFTTHATVSYTDPAGDTFNVRITSLREKWPNPADQPGVGRQSTLEVKLVQV